MDGDKCLMTNTTLLLAEITGPKVFMLEKSTNTEFFKAGKEFTTLFALKIGFQREEKLE